VVPFKSIVPDEKRPFATTTAAKVDAPTAVAVSRRQAPNTASDPTVLRPQRRDLTRATCMVCLPEPGPLRDLVRGPGAVLSRCCYWLMLQVNGSVAVRPWSALVAAVESSWTVIEYVADAEALSADSGVVPNVALARPASV
jgi:hypothetical protein